MMKKKYIAWILIVSILFLGRGADAMAKTSLSKPLGVLANGVDGQVVLSWESVQRADGYEVFEKAEEENVFLKLRACLLYTSPSPRDISGSRMPSSA